MKRYELDLPVLRQGDDLRCQIEVARGGRADVTKEELAAALIRQARCYDEAADLCRSLAAVVAETEGFAIEADGHVIEVEGPDQAVAELVKNKVLSVFDDGEGFEDAED